MGRPLQALRASSPKGAPNSLSQNLTVLPAPSGREPLAYPQALHFSRKLYRYAKGPILEEDFPRPGEDVTEGDKKGNLSRSD